MATYEASISNLKNKINILKSKLNEYKNMQEKITQVISRLNFAIGEGEKAGSMFERSYSESNTAAKKLKELTDENQKITEMKNSLTGVLEQIEMEIKNITNDILVMQERLEALMLAEIRGE